MAPRVGAALLALCATVAAANPAAHQSVADLIAEAEQYEQSLGLEEDDGCLPPPQDFYMGLFDNGVLENKFFGAADVGCDRVENAGQAVPDFMKVLPPFVQPEGHPFKIGSCKGDGEGGCGKELHFARFAEGVKALWTDPKLDPTTALPLQISERHVDGLDELVNIAWRGVVFNHNIATVTPPDGVNAKPPNPCWQLVIEKLMKFNDNKPLAEKWLNGGDKCGFWTGGIGVSMFGRAIGKNMLEESMVGKMFDPIGREIWGSCDSHVPTPWIYGGLWNLFSEQFASSCTGIVTVYMKARGEGSVLYRKEWPQLFEKYNYAEGTPGKVDDIEFIQLFGKTGWTKTPEEAAEQMMTLARVSLSSMKDFAAKQLGDDPHTNPLCGSVKTKAGGNSEAANASSFVRAALKNEGPGSVKGGFVRDRIQALQRRGSVFSMSAVDKEQAASAIVEACKQLTRGDELYLVYQDKISKENMQRFGDRSSEGDHWGERILASVLRSASPSARIPEDGLDSGDGAKMFALDEAPNPKAQVSKYEPMWEKIPSHKPWNTYLLDLAQGILTLNYQKVWHICIHKRFPLEAERTPKAHGGVAETDDYRLSKAWGGALKPGDTHMILHQDTYRKDLDEMNDQFSEMNPFYDIYNSRKAIGSYAAKIKRKQELAEEKLANALEKAARLDLDGDRDIGRKNDAFARLLQLCEKTTGEQGDSDDEANADWFALQLANKGRRGAVVTEHCKGVGCW